MWTAITAAVIMGGLVWVARIAAAVPREKAKAHAEAMRQQAIVRLEESALVRIGLNEANIADAMARLETMEPKVAAIQSAQALRPRR